MKFSPKILNNFPKLKPVLDNVEKLFENYHANIPNNFPQYTLHGQAHIESLFRILEWLVPNEVWKELNQYELFCLIVSLMGHDIGMGISSDLLDEFIGSYKTEDIGERTNFMRIKHPQIAAFLIRKELPKINIEPYRSLANICAMIAESHGNYELADMGPRIAVGTSGDFVEPTFLAILVRLSDLLHCTADRAPVWLFSRITDPVSIEHWRRQQGTVGVAFDEATQSIQISITTDDINCFANSVEYYNQVKKELDYCAEIFSKCRIKESLKIRTFKCDLVHIVPFIPEVIRFTMDVHSAIKTLTGKYLYNDKSVVVRELLQNAIDACTLRIGQEQGVKGIISVEYDLQNNQLTVSDTGIGMNLTDVKSKLLRSCSKGFREYKTPGVDLISKFGIGFLSTFIMANSIRVMTRHYQEAEKDGLALCIKNTEDPVLINKTSAPIGTKVILFIDHKVNLTETDLSKWIPLPIPDIDITFLYNGKAIKREDPNPGIVREHKVEYIEWNTKEEEFILNMRIPVVSQNNRIKWICGLSWNSLDRFSKEVIELPDISSQIFYKGIPFFRRGQSTPTSTNGFQPLFSRLFAPFKLNFTKPGVVDMNLARDAFIQSEGNDQIFDKIDKVLTDQLLYFYTKYIKGNHELTAQFLSEFWIVGNIANWNPLIMRGRLNCIHNPHLEKFQEVFLNCLLRVSYPDMKEEVIQFKDIINNSGVIILCDQCFIEIIRHECGIKAVQDIINKLYKVMSDQGYSKIYIVTECAVGKIRPIDNLNFLNSFAKSIALVDIYDSRLRTPPFMAFNYGSQCFQDNTEFSIQVLGTNRPICAYLEVFKAYGMQATGSSGYWIIYNLSAKHPYEDNILRVLQNADTQKHIFRGGRNNIFEHLELIGMPKEYIEHDFIHDIFQG